MTTDDHVLAFYTRPERMTSIGKHGRLVESLPRDVAALARIVSGLLLYEYVATEFYGITVPEDRRNESHIRPAEGMLDCLLRHDDRPLDAARPLEKRVVGICHHFMLLTVAILRAKGVPARGRCGFGSYFNAPYFEDHWVAEYWNAAESRWVLIDAQMDDVWRQRLGIDFDPLDVPRDRFVVAGDSWAVCRAGEADPSKFGIFKGDQRGLWFVAGNVVRDLAALNKTEMLPWDVWGAMPLPDEPLDDTRLEHFDQLAALTRAPEASFAELRAHYMCDDRLHVPQTVFNAIRNRTEAV